MTAAERLAIAREAARFDYLARRLAYLRTRKANEREMSPRQLRPDPDPNLPAFLRRQAE